MPRQVRIQYLGAMYHVMSRGNRLQDIYLDDVDRQDFLKTLAEACQKTGWQVHAYCLMSNHYHLVLETPIANLVAGMAWLQGTYTIRLNHRHKLIGHVLSGRYKAQLLEGSGTGYLRSACDYGSQRGQASRLHLAGLDRNRGLTPLLDFPIVAIQICEVATVASPEYVLSRLHDLPASLLGER